MCINKKTNETKTWLHDDLE